MPGPTSEARIYLLDADERRITSDGPFVVGPDGVREDLPPLAFAAVQHVLEAMRAGMAINLPTTPRTANRRGSRRDQHGRDDLRAYAAEGAVPFRSTDSVDWVDLATVIAWGNNLRTVRA
ncbi:hypothetical protein [Kribbella endophytica]